MTFLSISRIHVIGLFVLMAILAVSVFVEPVPQDPTYHLFADNNTVFAGIPNTWNVLSNLPFVIVGILGLINLSKVNALQPFSILYLVFFTGLLLTGVGSAYYHWFPSNHTLVWDRLPMTISFMSFFTLILCCHTHERFANRSLAALLATGFFSVVYWAWSESQHRGDLRFYALVQFLPMILIPAFMLALPQTRYRYRSVWAVIGLYILAKIAEHWDAEVYLALGISGHSLKHIIAALPGLVILSMARHIETQRRADPAVNDLSLRIQNN